MSHKNALVIEEIKKIIRTLETSDVVIALFEECLDQTRGLTRSAFFNVDESNLSTETTRSFLSMISSGKFSEMREIARDAGLKFNMECKPILGTENSCYIWVSHENLRWKDAANTTSMETAGRFSIEADDDVGFIISEHYTLAEYKARQQESLEL